MRIKIELQGKTYEPVVELRKDTAVINFNGRTQTYLWKHTPDNRLSISPQPKGESIEIDISMLKLGAKSLVKINGLPYNIKAELVSVVKSELPPAAYAAAPAPLPPPQPKIEKAESRGKDWEGALRPPMPGKIIDVKVGLGAKVVAGQLILILEAMKMQNEITAPFGGIIKELNVSPGQSVTIDDVLAVIERC